LTVTNTLAYRRAQLNRAAKILFVIMCLQGACTIKLFTAVIYGFL
jgi:hypothetical protein